MGVGGHIVSPSGSAHICHASACRRRRVEKIVSWHALLCVARCSLSKPRGACVAVNTSCDRLSRNCSAAWAVCQLLVRKILNSVVGCAFARLVVYVGNSSVDSVKLLSTKLSCRVTTYGIPALRLEQVVACIELR